MTIHKNTKLTPIQRKEIFRKHYHEGVGTAELARTYQVSRTVIYRILHRGRNKDFSVHKSINQRFRCLEYGMKRLAKVEAELEKKLKQRAVRYNKSYPGEMIHADTVLLPRIDPENPREPREYLFVAVDDFSRELYAALFVNKTQDSAAEFLKQTLQECPYTVEQWYTDNGTEWKGNPKHRFVRLCREYGISQGFTRVSTPRTNGKAERVIRTILEMWYNKTRFKSSVHRKQELIRFVNYYNTVKPHKGIENMTPFEKLIQYFYPKEL